MDEGYREQHSQNQACDYGPSHYLSLRSDSLNDLCIHAGSCQDQTLTVKES